MQTYRTFNLDPFQQDAIAAIDDGHSVIVSAPTGTGKTLVADYLVDKALAETRKIIYTAPIKALSNQKYRDFSRQFGAEAVGIMTGDIVINPRAPLLIMTTEIFRNQVITGDPDLADFQYIIFDEIHWLNDEARGTVWEESIILVPAHMRLLGLSATISNADELKDWIAGIRGQELILIEEPKRCIPLEYRYYTKQTKFCTYPRLKAYYDKTLHNLTLQDLSEISQLFEPTTHIDLIKEIENEYFPCLYFSFSRRQCNEKATELASIRNYLNPTHRKEVQSEFIRQFGGESGWSPSTHQLYNTCSKGIAFHHAGMLPSQKQLVETLFLARLLSVLYCTETFSVGINYPVRAVCFDALYKYDGHSFRSLKNHEFFQMSGRAGRRGIDKKGFSFAIADFNEFRRNPIPRFDIRYLEPLASQFRLTYNTVLNLVATLTPDQIQTYFLKSFASHTFRRVYAETQQQIDELTLRLTQIHQTACDKIGSLSCPLEYSPQAGELHRLRRSYKRLDHRHRRKSYGRRLQQKIRRLENLLNQAGLSTPPPPCPKQSDTLCHDLNKQRLSILETQDQLKASLALSDSETLYNQFIYKTEQLKQLGYIDSPDILPPDTGIPPDQAAPTGIPPDQAAPTGHLRLAARGNLARQIYVEELFVTELIFSGHLDTLSIPSLCALISCIDYENRKNDYFVRPQQELIPRHDIREILTFLQSVCGPDAVRFDPRVAVVAYAWSEGKPLNQVQKLCNLDEGDIISIFRRTIDLMRQMREALPQGGLRSRLSEGMKTLDRDEAALLINS
ncbi:MAG: DEAD/DEAH box helicase [Peptococcaceae bacterium]|nr:DEAD/DEAH box helicase [Peptococcaceae bacterium]